VEILRLHLGTLRVVTHPWPVHGFVVKHPEIGAVLIDTGCGGPEALLREYAVVNRSIATALSEHGLSPADVRLVINTHLHFDHCGQNAVFPHAPVCVQRAELSGVRQEGGAMSEWLEASGTRFELFEGDTRLTDDVRVVATPGHTAGHQSVVVSQPDGTEVFVGDAAFTRAIWRAENAAPLPPGQAEDLLAWRHSLQGLRDLTPTSVHFCHDTSWSATPSLQRIRSAATYPSG
jgi:N-acyl homoserine lactone hydrolase